METTTNEVSVEPFRFWWKVSWQKEGKEHELLFKKAFRAHQYAHLLEQGQEEGLGELERNRLL